MPVPAGKPVSAIEWDVVHPPTHHAPSHAIPYNPPKAIMVPHQGKPRFVSCLCTLVAGVNGGHMGGGQEIFSWSHRFAFLPKPTVSMLSAECWHSLVNTLFFYKHCRAPDLPCPEIHPIPLAPRRYIYLRWHSKQCSFKMQWKDHASTMHCKVNFALDAFVDLSSLSTSN